MLHDLLMQIPRYVYVIVAIVIFIILFRSFFARKQQYFARPVLTNFETKMFIRLKKACPQHHVLAQVAFSALITSRDYKLRNKFNRKVTDFVILDQQMDVLAIIELDDPSHLGKEAEDQQRDEMLFDAGYQVFRYTKIPTIAQLQRDLS